MLMTSKMKKITEDKEQVGKRVDIEAVKNKGGTRHPDILDRVKEVLNRR